MHPFFMWIRSMDSLFIFVVFCRADSNQNPYYIMPSERWLCLSISARKHSPSENAGLQGFLLAFLDNISPWGSSWKRSRPSVFSPRCFILQAFQYAFEFFILGKSSEVMLAADPILLGQNMRFRSFISIRPFINTLADGCASVGWRG